MSVTEISFERPRKTGLSVSKTNISEEMKTVKVGDVIDGQVVKKRGNYLFINTKNEGIMKLVGTNKGYLVSLDYGRRTKFDKKKGMYILKQDKTLKKVETEKEARLLRAEAENIRSGKGTLTEKPRVVKFTDALSEYVETSEYKSRSLSAKDHDKNYFNHFNDYFRDMEPKKITRIDIENYFSSQLERGNRSNAKRNKDGRISKKEGISINTLSKHKTALKKIWIYFVDSKKYGVVENVVEKASLPKVKITIDGKDKLVSKIVFNPRPLNLEELNYTLNDIAQNEFDRSILMMAGLAAIGSLRHSEVLGLEIGKVFHNELMTVDNEAMKISGFNKQYYKEHDELMFIDTAIMHVGGKNVTKLPKGNVLRVSAIPNVLKKIFEYALEQRKEIYEITGKKLCSTEKMFIPLYNVLKDNDMNSEKLSRKWNEYQKRRNKRMVKAGLEPIDKIRFHDLRHTHSNLLKITCPSWEISANMGHVIPDSNTTQKVYWTDREPYRDDIIKFFDENIKIDWDKALHKKINEKESNIFVNGSGHIVITSEELKRQKASGKKKFIFKEVEIEEMFLPDDIREKNQ